MPPTRRDFLVAVGAACATGSIAQASAEPSGQPAVLEVAGQEHWTTKRAGADSVKLFLWRKRSKNALDTSVPTGTYVDMSANLPVVDPEKISVPTLIMRGQWDGIASFQDLANFFARLPNPDKQFIVMPGIAHTSTRSKNWALVYHLLDAYFSQPAPVYVG